jgi:hypothetical protein
MLMKTKEKRRWAIRRSFLDDHGREQMGLCRVRRICSVQGIWLWYAHLSSLEVVPSAFGTSKYKFGKALVIFLLIIEAASSFSL